MHILFRDNLNNGSGTGFTKMAVPSTSQGSAEAVTPIDYDGNGLTDFLVENGNAGKPGPVQLIAFFPALRAVRVPGSRLRREVWEWRVTQRLQRRTVVR